MPSDLRLGPAARGLSQRPGFAVGLVPALRASWLDRAAILRES